MTLTLATFCGDTDQPVCDWTPDLTGVHDAGPHVAGVLLAAPRSWAARLINDSAPRSAVELITYTIPEDDGYRVCLLAQWCTWDPATLHITWSADHTWEMRDPWPTREAAAFAASELAWGMASGYGRLVMALGQFSHETFGPVLGWDGQPFHDGDA